MAARNPRDPWRVAWHAATANGTLTVLLVAIAAALALAASIPQVPGSDAIARARHLSSLQARYGNVAQVIESLGLFTIMQSWGFRVLIAFAACGICLRTVELAGCFLRTDDRRPESASLAGSSGLWTASAGDAVALISHAGAILLVIGMAVTQVWGWEAREVILQDNDRVALGGRNAWVALSADGRVTASPAVRIGDEYRGPGARVRAVDGEGQLLPLQQSPEAAQASELTLPLTRDPDLATRHALFAIPQANLIIRLVPRGVAYDGPAAELLVQAYRSPSGELAAEAFVSGAGTVAIGDVTLEIDSAPYVMLSAAVSPGLWPASAGVIIVLVGILVSIARQTGVIRRLRRIAPAPGPVGSSTLRGKDGVS